jgi:hypothetical protein
VDVPKAEPLTVEVVEEIEDDSRLLAVAAVARRHIAEDEEAASPSKSEEG